MGWRGRMLTIPVGMVFRKMYCHQCGAKLKKEKTSKVYKKGELGYTNQLPGHFGEIPLGMSELEKVGYFYQCPNCKLAITYDEQCMIAKKQKQLKKIILTEEELEI